MLEQTPYVRFNRLARVGHLVQEEILRRQIVVRSTMEIDNLEGVVAMVANGLAPRWCRPGREERVPRHHPRDSFGSPTVTRRLGILVPKENPRSHLSRLLLEALKSVCADSQEKERAGSR